MINIIKYPPENSWNKWIARPSIESGEIRKLVETILRDVRETGDSALKKYSELYDGVALKELEVDQKDIDAATVDEGLASAIEMAATNIARFHKEQKVDERRIETQKGIQCWRKGLPIEKVGFYIPGGTAPLFSTILMLGIPAAIAGCKEKIICTPPGKDGSIHPAILYTAKKAGIEKIYKTGGAQAIAAMAYGTETVPKVDKIFGPGNQYVTKAKEMIQMDGVAIDLPAGPSELLVIADASANADFVAADLLSQAEHGADSQVIVLSNDLPFLENINASIKSQLNYLGRRDIARTALKNSFGLLLSSMEECMRFSNAYAPEHLIISCEEEDRLSNMVFNAGSVFIGSFSCESIGDYASGTNHTLPTSGMAKAYSGVSLDSFLKKVTFQKVEPAGLRSIGRTVKSMAEAEGLDAHSKAVEVRLKYLNNE